MLEGWIYIARRIGSFLILEIIRTRCIDEVAREGFVNLGNPGE